MYMIKQYVLLFLYSFLSLVASASKLKKPQSSNTNQSTKDEEKAGNSNMSLPAPRIAENFLNTAPTSSSSSSNSISKVSRVVNFTLEMMLSNVKFHFLIFLSSNFEV